MPYVTVDMVLRPIFDRYKKKGIGLHAVLELADRTTVEDMSPLGDYYHELAHLVREEARAQECLSSRHSNETVEKRSSLEFSVNSLPRDLMEGQALLAMCKLRGEEE